MKFEWDPQKAEANRLKHGVDFEEARTVYFDPAATTFVDPDHLNSEQRLLTVGYSSQGRLLVVYHVDRADVTRLIGARIATRHERKNHEGQD